MWFRSKHALVALFLVGLAVQLAALPLRGTFDVRTFKLWAIAAQSHGLWGVYAPEADPRPDYPPLSVAMLAGAAKMLEFLGEPIQLNSRKLTFLVKLPTLAARLLMFALIYRLARRHFADGNRAIAVAVAFWLNPALWLNGPVLGYLDSICWAAGVAAVVCASTNRLVAAAALATCSALFKPQGVFFLLPVAVAAWNSPKRLRAASTAAALGALVIAPFVLVSGAEPFVRAMSRNAVDDALSGNALNFWWLVTAAARTAQHGWQVFDVPLLWMRESEFAAVAGVVAPRPFAAAVVLAAAAWAGFRIRGAQSLPLLAAYGAFVVHVYCALAVGVHENHLVYVVALLQMVAFCDARYRRLFMMISALAAVNMALFYGLGRDFPRLDHTGLFFVTTTLSLANLALLVAHAALFRCLLRRETAAQRGGAASEEVRGLAATRG